MQNNTQESWEKDIIETLKEAYSRNDLGEKWAVAEISSTISLLLSKQAEEISEAVEGLMKPRMKEIEIDMTIEAYGLKGGMSIAQKNGYNEAINDTLLAIKQITNK